MLFLLHRQKQAIKKVKMHAILMSKSKQNFTEYSGQTYIPRG